MPRIAFAASALVLIWLSAMPALAQSLGEIARKVKEGSADVASSPGTPSTAPATTLADVARQAEEERQRRGATNVMTISNRDLPAVNQFQLELRDFLLDHDNIGGYFGARESMAVRRRNNMRVDAEILAREVQAQGPIELEAAYDGDPLVMEALRSSHIRLHTFILTYEALKLAVADMDKPPAAMKQLSKTRQANAAFVKERRKLGVGTGLGPGYYEQQLLNVRKSFAPR